MEKFIEKGHKFTEFYFNTAFLVFGMYGLFKGMLYLIEKI